MSIDRLDKSHIKCYYYINYLFSYPELFTEGSESE